MVATSAAYGEAECGFGDDIDLVVGEADLFIEGVDGSEAVEDHAILCGADF